MRTEKQRIYHRNHHRVRTDRGQAKLQDCVDCGMSAADWSQIHDTDGESIWDCEPRCRRCHRIYDGVGEKNSAALKIRMIGNTYWLGRKHTEEELAKMSAARQGFKYTDESKVKMSASQLARRQGGK